MTIFDVNSLNRNRLSIQDLECLYEKHGYISVINHGRIKYFESISDQDKFEYSLKELK